jgi:fluoride exporter
MLKSALAVLIGGSTGCLLRWLIAIRYNPVFTPLPLGTLFVNLAGGLIIGASLAWFNRHPQWDPAWKLLLTTGLCGGLTTFSTFSAELMGMLQSGNYLWALISASLHLFGSLLFTIIGFMLINRLLG